VFLYKGVALQTTYWKISSENSRLLLGAARHWQAHLIFYLYSQKKRRENFLYIHPDASDDVFKQIASMQPDSSKAFGNIPDKWEPKNRRST